MENITSQFKDAYVPHKGIIVFKNGTETGEGHYVESFDFTHDDRPINFHPLSVMESLTLSETLYPDADRTAFLHHEGILPNHVLYLNNSFHGSALWYSPAKVRRLFFGESLHMPSGPAHVPAMLWYASKTHLQVFALKTNARPKMSTQLYHAPYFNIDNQGWVCMGSVNVDVPKNCSLLDFMDKWESYFFKSYFTHLILKTSPVKGNITQFWTKHVGSGKKFPPDILLPHSMTIKRIIHATNND